MTYNAPVKRESDNQLGRAMWQWRTEQRLSMRGAAERLGVSHSTWGALERGERSAEADTLQRLADLLQRSVDELMRWEGRASFRPSADDAERARRVEELIRADARLSRLLDVVAMLPAKEIDLLLSIADDLRKRNE